MNRGSAALFGSAGQKKKSPGKMQAMSGAITAQNSRQQLQQRSAADFVTNEQKTRRWVYAPLTALSKRKSDRWTLMRYDTGYEGRVFSERNACKTESRYINSRSMAHAKKHFLCSYNF